MHTLYEKSTMLIILLLSFAFFACDNGGGLSHDPSGNNGASSAAEPTSSSSIKVEKVDYSKARAMNKRLGRGINFGNSWEAPGLLDNGWGNKIQDEWFDIVKEAGFTSIRLPNRFSQNAEEEAPFTISQDRFEAYKKHIDRAHELGMPVIVDFHHYDELLDDIKQSTIERNRWSAEIKNLNAEISKLNLELTSNELKMDRILTYGAEIAQEIEAGFRAELIVKEARIVEIEGLMNVKSKEMERFAAIWEQVAEALDVYPDSMLVFEAFNEPNGISNEMVNLINKTAYDAIRKHSKGKTIILNPNEFAKFYKLKDMVIPKDGNLIITGHYYEPYEYSHQGHGYKCLGDEAWAGDKEAVQKMKADFDEYVAMAQEYFPDVNGGHIPLHMGEFGVSGKSCRGDEEENPSDERRALWTKELIQIAESHDISWHYWGFAGVGGFEAYDKKEKAWYPGMLEALTQD